jgi:hypothetical protein
MLATPRTPKAAAEGELAAAIKALDPNSMTPLDALTWLAKSRSSLLTAEDEAGSGGKA